MSAKEREALVAIVRLADGSPLAYLTNPEFHAAVDIARHTLEETGFSVRPDVLDELRQLGAEVAERLHRPVNVSQLLAVVLGIADDTGVDEIVELMRRQEP